MTEIHSKYISLLFFQENNSHSGVFQSYIQAFNFMNQNYQTLKSTEVQNYKIYKRGYDTSPFLIIKAL